MMHEELVKRLREIHPEEFGDAWDFAFACQKAMREAAEVIEELEKEVQNWKITAGEEASGLEHWFENYQKDVPLEKESGSIKISF